MHRKDLLQQIVLYFLYILMCTLYVFVILHVYMYMGSSATVYICYTLYKPDVIMRALTISSSTQIKRRIWTASVHVTVSRPRIICKSKIFYLFICIQRILVRRDAAAAFAWPPSVLQSIYKRIFSPEFSTRRLRAFSQKPSKFYLMNILCLHKCVCT